MGYLCPHFLESLEKVGVRPGWVTGHLAPVTQGDYVVEMRAAVAFCSSYYPDGTLLLSC